MKSKSLAIILITLLMTPLVANADKTPLTQDKRKEYKEKVRQYKHQIIATDLKLTREQANNFFKEYDEMEDELDRIGTETHELETRTLNNKNASDTECENVARALFELKKNEADIELKYFERFKTILTPQQLVGLKRAEMNCRRKIVKHFRLHQAD